MVASRSPSPVLEAAPISDAPGQRAARLIRLHNEAVNHVLKTCDYANFSACFPTPARYVDEDMRRLHKGFIDRLGERCRDEFTELLQDRNVVPLLNELDRLVDEARQRKLKAEQEHQGQAVQPPQPLHTLPAASLYNSRLRGTLQLDQADLMAQLEQIQRANLQLGETLNRQRGERDNILNGLQAIITDLDQSLAMCPHDDLVQLTEATVRDHAVMQTL